MPNRTSAPGARGILSEAELAAFRRDGFLVPRYRLPPKDLAALQALTERIVADNPRDWRARLALSRHYTAAGEHRLALDHLLEALPHHPHGLALHLDIWDALSAVGLDPALVRRYTELAREAVFYLDPHVCRRCRYRSTELLWYCPQCHEWNTFVEERIAPARETATES